MRPPVFQDQLPMTDHGRHRFENVMEFISSGSILATSRLSASSRHALTGHPKGIAMITSWVMVLICRPSWTFLRRPGSAIRFPPVPSPVRPSASAAAPLSEWGPGNQHLVGVENALRCGIRVEATNINRLFIEKNPFKSYHHVTFAYLIRYEFNVDAYRMFYNENKDRLFAYLLRMTGDYHLACDLVHESFVRYLGRYGNNSDSRPLLYTIAHNAAIDAMRKQKPESLDEGSHEDPQKNPEQQMIDRQAFESMQAAINKLSPPDRELISLVATADLSYREIGNVLNISESNVKVKVHRARTKLREILASGGD